MVAPFTHRLIPAEVLTTSQYIFGQIKVIQSGLVGMLADTTNSILEMSDASITPVLKPSSVLNYAVQMYLVRSQVAVVCLNKREYLGPQGVIKSGFQRPVPYPVRISTRSYDISGTLEWSGRFEFSALMASGTNDFITIFDASLSAPLCPELMLTPAAMLINRTFIESLIITKLAPTTPIITE